ncbi:MAG: ATP-binding cassette domain-containing protein [Caldilineaceae bacterium]
MVRGSHPGPQIVVRALSKSYRVPERQAGLRAALHSLVRRQHRDVRAVCDVNFTVEPGEVVALLGPNGAGKTTTLKMLAGLLQPTQGAAQVAGFVPWRREYDYLRQISMVLGNKSQLMWSIPPMDTFVVLGEIYRLPRRLFHQTLDELVTLLEMQALLTKPVRNLSLGERMKCELVAGLLHRPQVLFLDEPTLGLDVSMQRRLREFLAAYNREHGVTILLTSHYMADVVALCRRVLLVNQGKLLYDGLLNQLAEQLAPFKLVKVTLAHEITEALSLPTATEIVTQEPSTLTLRVRREEIARVTAALLQTLPVADLAVEDPPIEAVIDQLYQQPLNTGGDL